MTRRPLLTLPALALILSGCDALVTKPSLYGSVVVRVERRNGDPIAGANLTLYTGVRRMAYGTTDTNGAFTFRFVPEGRYGVSTDLPAGYARIGDLLPGQPTDFVDQIIVVPGAAPNALLTLLKQGTGSITASVTEPDGKPLAGVELTLYTATGTLKTAQTDAAGRYTFTDVPFGNLGVNALRTAAFLDSAETPLLTRDGILIEDGTAETANFTFARCSGGIAASVRDNTGAPIPGVPLTLYNSLSALGTAVTDSAGSHIFANLGCADFGVRVESVPIGWTLPPGRGSTFTDGLFVHRGATRATTLTIQRVACRGTIRARVTETGGANVSGARILLYTGADAYAEKTSGTDGVVTFDQLPCNREWGVLVTPPATHTVAPGSGSAYFDGIVLTDGIVVERTFLLSPTADR